MTLQETYEQFRHPGWWRVFSLINAGDYRWISKVSFPQQRGALWYSLSSCTRVCSIIIMNAKIYTSTTRRQTHVARYALGPVIYSKGNSREKSRIYWKLLPNSTLCCYENLIIHEPWLCDTATCLPELSVRFPRSVLSSIQLSLVTGGRIKA
jgi:hypothetical protein